MIKRSTQKEVTDPKDPEPAPYVSPERRALNLANEHVDLSAELASAYALISIAESLIGIERKMSYTSNIVR